MLFGKIKDTDDWGFNIFENTFESFVEVDDKEHIELIEKANNTDKIIVGDKDGKPVLADPPEPTDEQKAEQRIRELENYLSSTDWYVIRYADEGTPIPQEVKKKRAEARKEISALKA